MKSNREKKRWEDAIADIDRVAQREVEVLKAELDDYRRSQEQLFRRSKRRIMKAFERTIHQRANDTADSNVTTRALKVQYALLIFIISLIICVYTLALSSIHNALYCHRC